MNIGSFSLLFFVSLVCSGVRASQTGMKNMKAEPKKGGTQSCKEKNNGLETEKELRMRRTRMKRSRIVTGGLEVFQNMACSSMKYANSCK